MIDALMFIFAIFAVLLVVLSAVVTFAALVVAAKVDYEGEDDER